MAELQIKLLIFNNLIAEVKPHLGKGATCVFNHCREIEIQTHSLTTQQCRRLVDFSDKYGVFYTIELSRNYLRVKFTV